MRLLSFVMALLFAVCTDAHAAEQAPWSADLAAIRNAAKLIPGAKATRIDVVKFAESLRSKKFSVKGAADEPSIQARTAYRLDFPDGTAMIDSGMELQIHKYFARGAEEPYYPEQAKAVEDAVRQARFIVVTHEHGDHVAGVIRDKPFDQIAAKTILTRTQVQSLMTAPQFPEIRLTPEMASHYIVVDYDRYLPIAPGIVLVKAPGHTPGSQMVYVVLQSGREYLFVGDVGWQMDNIRLMTGKDANWIVEDEPKIEAELKWLNGIWKNEKNLFIVVSHDETQRLDYVKNGIMGDGFQ